MDSQKTPNLFAALFGLVFQPIEMVERLLSREDPPYTGGVILSLFAIVFTPIIAQLYRWQFLETQAVAIFSLAFTLLTTAVIFILVEYALLWLMGTELEFKKFIALFCYSLAPLIPLAMTYYLFNYWVFDRLTLVTFLITGQKDADDWLFAYFPAVLLLGQGLFLVVFFAGLRLLGDMKSLSALLLTIFSAIPFFLIFMMAIKISSYIFPETDQTLFKLLYSLSDLLPFAGK